MAKSNQTNKYAYLSRLSTKELESILRADTESLNAVNDEAISYILEVIEQREHEHPSGSFPDVDHSWNEFLTIYNTLEGTNRSLYPNEDNEDPHVLSAHLTQKHHRRMRRSILVAAIIALLIASLTIPVAGYGNLLQMIGNWTAEQFTFIATGYSKGSSETEVGNEESSDLQIGEELRQVLQEYGITEPIVPSWLPDGYELANDISVEDYPAFNETEFFAFYSDGENSCTISITRTGQQVYGSTYEKVFGSPEIYSSGDVEYYIFQNVDSIIAAWYVDNLECSINTTMSESDLKGVIDSIYY